MREKFPGETLRMPALPEAVPHLTLGYSVFAAGFFHEKLKDLPQIKSSSLSGKKALSAAEFMKKWPVDRGRLWKNTVFPASEQENWFVSASAGYYRLLNAAPEQQEKLVGYLKENFQELSLRLQYLMNREGSVVPVKVSRSYEKYNSYQLPRLRGIFFLHQLRLLLGNEQFLQLMNEFQQKFSNREFRNHDFLALLKKFSPDDRALRLFKTWLEDDCLPQLRIEAQVEELADKSYRIKLSLQQLDRLFDFTTSVLVQTSSAEHLFVLNLSREKEEFELQTPHRPQQLIFNYTGDIPLPAGNIFSAGNFFDEFATTKIVYGTAAEIEANHTLALRYQTLLADTFTEILLPVVKDCEISAQELKESNLIILGGAYSNSLLKEVLAAINFKAGRNFFYFQNRAYGDPQDGLIMVLPSIYNPQRFMMLIVANSALELYQLTKSFFSSGQWALFKNDRLLQKGFFSDEQYTINF